MRVVRVDSHAPEASAIEAAARELARGQLVAFPTETVYGLGARASDAAAVAKIFAAKGRPASHPLIAHVLGEHDARALARAWPERASALAAAFWPGPLTLVVSRAAHVADAITAGGDSVALRAPSHPVARALLAALGEPIVAPSANRYQSLSPTRAEHVVSQFEGAEWLLIDAGPCAAGIESTVVDVRPPVARVLRPGSVTLEALRAVLGAVDFAPGQVIASGAIASPGMDARHYSPRARLEVATSRAAAIARAEAGAALVLFGEGGPVDAHRLPADPHDAGSALYALLHALDAAAVATIVVEPPPARPGWEAVSDRLARASVR